LTYFIKSCIILSMTNKIFKLGMLVLAFVFAFMVFGCKQDTEEEDLPYTWTFDNKSSVVVTVVCDDIKPTDFTINANQVKTAKSAKTIIKIAYGPSDKVECDTSVSGKFIFKNK
jgi:hypothetical protein